MGLGLSPQYGTDHKLAVSTYVNGTFTSDDTGNSWAASNLGLAQRAFWDDQPDSYARLHNIVYAPPANGRSWMYTSVAAEGGAQGGVLRSSNGGASWSLTTVPGFSNPTIDPELNRIPFVVPSPSFATDHTVMMADGGNGAVYRSTDEGASFQLVATLPRLPRCLLVSPTFATDHRLLACTNAGVYVSTNMGSTWTPTRNLNLTDLAVVVQTGVGQTWLAATASGLLPQHGPRRAVGPGRASGGGAGHLRDLHGGVVSALRLPCDRPGHGAGSRPAALDERWDLLRGGLHRAPRRQRAARQLQLQAHDLGHRLLAGLRDRPDGVRVLQRPPVPIHGWWGDVGAAQRPPRDALGSLPGEAVRADHRFGGRRQRGGVGQLHPRVRRQRTHPALRRHLHLDERRCACQRYRGGEPRQRQRPHQRQGLHLPGDGHERTRHRAGLGGVQQRRPRGRAGRRPRP